MKLQLLNKIGKWLTGVWQAVTSWFSRLFRKLVTYPKGENRLTVALTFFVLCFATALAQTGSYEAGTTALTTVATEITKYVPVVVKLCYAIAGVVAIVGAISVYVSMNNDEQDVKKKIMMVVGACIFLIAAAQCLPMVFGISS